MANTSPPGKHPTADQVEALRACALAVTKRAHESYGSEALEPDLERALEILQSAPEQRQELETELISLLDPAREGIVELVAFTMHELRWPRIEQEIRRRITEHTGNVSDIRLYEAMLDAFSDSWRDRDLYERFSSN
ncbi:hypothetical protein AB0B79_27220 [Streptomyces sp. NPDC039022]|uniref:hypothetical protein n=1 Tax=unclassified Streptomyces TaxID=2593676 RepID=UPI0033CCDBAE